MAVVQEVFEGSKCRDGLIKKGSNVRIMRGDKILQEIKVGTLWNLRAKVDTIESGDECGIGLLDFEDFQFGGISELLIVIDYNLLFQSHFQAPLV